MELIDSYNRKIDYLRLSVTEKCNLHCEYCMPQNNSFLPLERKSLPYSEMIFFVNLLAELGIKKIRLTGGEPLLYSEILKLIRDIKKIKSVKNISLTTNGVLLDKYLNDLKVLDIDSINISLDSISSHKYKMITGFDYSAKIYKNILKTLNMGFKMVKVNSVVSPYIDKDDIKDLIKKLQDLPLVLRFIEMMPTSAAGNIECRANTCDLYNKTKNQSSAIKIIESLKDYNPTEEIYGFGPARYYKSEKKPLTIGVINNDNESCLFCNRLRLTSKGKLILCIFSGKYLDLKKELVQNHNSMNIKNSIVNFIKKKPKNRTLANSSVAENCLNECMYKIGG